MWKGLAIFSGILLLGAAGVNYMTVAQMSTELKLRNEAEKNASDSEDHLKKGGDYREDNKKALATATARAQQMNRDLVDAKAKTETIIKKLTADTAALDEVKKNKDALDKTLADLGGLQVIVDELNALGAKKTDNTATIANQEAVVSLAHQKEAQTNAVIAAFKKKELMQSSGLMNDSFSGAISGIDPQWGFIMINKGNASNVVKGAKLDVKRGSEKIATIIVTNVQPTSSICDLVNGTLATGMALQPGDRLVVNEGSSEKNLAAPAAPAPGEPAPDGGEAPAPDAAPTTPAEPAPDPFAPAPSPPAEAETTPDAAAPMETPAPGN